MNPLQKAWSDIMGLDAATKEYEKKLLIAGALAVGVFWYLTKKR